MPGRRPEAMSFEVESAGPTLLQPLVQSDDVPRRSVTTPNKTLFFSLLYLLFMILFVIAAVMMERPFADNCPHAAQVVCEYTGCLNYSQYFAVILASISLPSCLIPIGLYAQNIISSYRSGFTSLDAAQAHLWALSIMCTLTAIASWVLLIKPWTVFAGAYGHGFDHYGLLQMYFGGFLAVLFPALAVVFGVTATRLRRASSRNYVIPGTTPPSPLEPSSFSSNSCNICIGLCVFIVAFLCTCSFSPVFNYSATSYMPATSPYSLLSIHVNDNFVTKMYEDAVVFYAAFAALILIGALTHFRSGLYAFVHKRLRVPCSRSALNPYPHGVSVGELLVVGFTLGLYIYWIHFFRFSYDRISKEARFDPHANAQIWARVFGHISNLSFSLLLLPATRNSIWESVFGIPFERALKYHRGLGVLAYLSVTTHMLIWFAKWGVEGHLGHNIFAIHDLLVAPTNYKVIDGACVGQIPHWDNFTIGINFFSWMMLTVMLGLAVFCRRKNYELFHYVHHFAWFYYIVALLHAWTFWYYASVGLTLYMIDRCIRLTRGLSSTARVALDHVDGITRLRLPAHLFSHHAGQYAFICVPAVSQTEWHPFTISSAPSDSERTFHIKDMGEGTFTNRLAGLAKGLSMTEVRVDGPYGRPAYIQGKRALLLVAGGIGITPMHSLIAELHHRATLQSRGVSRDSSPTLERVHLVWLCRSDDLISLFSPTIHALSLNNPRDIFHVSLHNTSKGPPLDSETSIADMSVDAMEYSHSIVQRGRPNFNSITGQLAVDFEAEDVLVMSCGPPGLCSHLSDLAFNHNFAHHTEEFHF